MMFSAASITMLDSMRSPRVTAVTSLAAGVDEHAVDDERALTDAVERLASVAAKSIARHGGDAVEAAAPAMVSAIFTRPADALACALDLQDGSPERASPLVRVAVHAGERDGALLAASPVRQAARLLSLARGGQLLVSRAAGDLLGDRLPPGVHLDDLGPHRPIDLGRPEHVLALRADGAGAPLVGLRSLEAVPNNLPVQLTSFVGRAGELTELALLLRATRLLTLTGPGGCGKTRLGLHLAAAEIDQHRDGVWLVDLAPIAAPDLVPSAVADAIGVGEVPYKTLEQALIDHLAPLEALLVLDNCEHLVDACGPFAERLVRGCPRVTVLATSREPLGSEGEVTWRVPSLGLPVDGDAVAESVRLFVDRATAARPTFRLDERNIASVTEICRQLDGIPLAIELAAARTRALTPAQIATQLADRFALLTGGRPGGVPRHRTLEASVDWSYALLGEDERAVLRRLGVFAGGFDLAAAEAVCAGDGLEPWAVLDSLTGLVDRSLLQLEDESGHGRYRLLETIRQYALAKLLDVGEVTAARHRHLDHYLAVGAHAQGELESRDMLRVVADLDLEIDNLRAAYDWAMQSGRTEDAWRLMSSLWLFWQRHRADEGAGRLTAALDAPGGDPAARALALIALGDLSYYSGDIARSRQLGEEAMVLAREAGDDRVLGRATNLLGVTGLAFGDPDAEAALLQALELNRAAGDDYFTIDTLIGLGMLAWLTGNAPLLRTAAADAVELARGSGNPQLVSRALFVLMASDWVTGDLDGMEAAVDEAIPLCTDLRDEIYGPMLLCFRAWLTAGRGRHDDALHAADGVFARAAAVNNMLAMAAALWVKAVVTDEAALPEADMALSQAHPVNMAAAQFPVAAECLCRLARLSAERGESASAADYVTAARELAAGPHGGGCRPWAALAAAYAAVAGEDKDAAAVAVHEAIAAWVAAGNGLGIVTALELLVALDVETGRHVEAARLLGAIGAERARLGWPPSPRVGRRVGAARSTLAAAMGGDGLAAAIAEGERMDLKEATAYARRGRGTRRKTTSGWASLTATELEVVRLVADGLKNAEIAERLFVSPVTVKSHLAHVFTKLGVGNRAELVAYALPRLGDTAS